ncbi:MAG: NTP transferase domain-containing protein [Vicinamibacterales bacterium]
MSAALVVLQARTGSSRLPGKVLEDICGLTVLERCVRRLRHAGCGPVVVATTLLGADDRVAEHARRLGAICVRGAVDDVLARFLLATREWHGPFVIRATADNPLVDFEACHRVLQQLSGGADYVVEASLPVGAAVEGMTTDALRQAGMSADDAYDREHVTPWIRRESARFRIAQGNAPAALARPDLRFTVDTGPDLDYVRRVVQLAGMQPLLPLEAYIEAADQLAARVAGYAPARIEMEEAS